MKTPEVLQNDHGLWHTLLPSARADNLLGALDPDAMFVLIETWDGNWDWHEATVSVGPQDEPRTRLVRHHRFDLLVTAAEALEIGRHFHARRIDGGGLGCYQFRQRPRADFRLPDSPRGRADAMRGQGVDLAIDLPRAGEVAEVCSPSKPTLIEYIQRFA